MRSYEKFNIQCVEETTWILLNLSGLDKAFKTDHSQELINIILDLLLKYNSYHFYRKIIENSIEILYNISMDCYELGRTITDHFNFQ